MRLPRVLVCAALMASSLIMPVGAWDKYSFVGDAIYFDQQRADAVQADSATQSLDYDTILPNLSYDGGVAAVFATTLHTVVGDVDGVQWVPSSRVQMTHPTVSPSGSYHVFMDGRPYAWPSDSDNLSYDGFLGPAFEFVDMDGVVGNQDSGYSSATFDIDISSLGSFSAFELSGCLSVRAGLVSGSGGNSLSVPYQLSITVVVNGADVRTFYPNSSDTVDFGNSVFSFSSPVQSIGLKISWPWQSYKTPTSWAIQVTFIRPSVLFGLTVLSGDSVLDGYVDDAQDSINDWDSIESEFGSDATEGFNGLDLDNFTYPSDFLAAFSLVSGIFTDLWNCMGDFQIIYLLPLTLGICLLLVGRVSRSSVPSPPPLHTDLPVSNSLGPPSRPALKGGKR